MRLRKLQRRACARERFDLHQRVVRRLLMSSRMKPLLAALLPFASMACFDHDGSGKVVSEARQAPLFEKIDISGTVEVLVAIDDEPTVRVETDDNLQEYILTEVRGKTLFISQKESIDPTKLLVRITTPKLVRFDSSGATKAQIKGLDEDRFELDVSGAAAVELIGEVETLVIDASGAAEIEADELIAERVEIDGSGAAEFTVHAKETLIADLSGAGEIRYSGDPDEVKTDLSGAATVAKR